MRAYVERVAAISVSAVNFSLFRLRLTVRQTVISRDPLDEAPEQ
jgi:hypothetical protein